MTEWERRVLAAIIELVETLNYDHTVDDLIDRLKEILADD